MERKIYLAGLFGKNELDCEENSRFYYYINGEDESILLDGDKSERTMKLLKRRNEEERIQFEDEIFRV